MFRYLLKLLQMFENLHSHVSTTDNLPMTFFLKARTFMFPVFTMERSVNKKHNRHSPIHDITTTTAAMIITKRRRRRTFRF